MTVQSCKSSSFFEKQDLTIEVLSILDPRSMARAFATCKDFHIVRHEAFNVFLRTCSGFVSLKVCARLSELSLKKVTDWGSLCKRMEAQFSVEMDLTGLPSDAKRQFQSVLSSNNIGRLRGLSVNDQFMMAGPLKGRAIIGNPELLAVTKVAPHLQQLALVRSGVTPEGLGCLQNLELEALSLTLCSKITDHVASALAGMTSLTELKLSHCEQVTEYGLRTLLQTLKNLKKVDISNPPGTCFDEKVRNHQMVQALTDHGKQLTHVTMDHLSCDFAKVEAMVKSCKNLVFLSRAIFLSFTSEDARKLQAINPHLSVRILKQQGDSLVHGVIFESSGRPRIKLLNPRRLFNPFKVLKPLPPQTTVEAYGNIMLRYSGPGTSFRHVGGDWKFHGENSNRCLMFAATTESLIDNFKLRGYPDGTISAWIGFNPKIFKDHLDKLGLKVVSAYDSAFKTTTKDELRQAIEILFRINEMPEPYLSQINEIVKGQLQEK